MYECGELRRGLKIELDGEPYIITQFEFTKPGKGTGLYKCKLKNMLTGSQFDKTFRSGEKIDEPNLEERQMEYLYYDGEKYCFMDTSNYEQEFLTEDHIGDARDYMKENIVCSVLFYDGRAIGLTLPTFMDLRVTTAEPWVKGDTSSGGTKPITLETGLVLQAPPFIEEGEKIRIDTRTGQYVERVKD